MKKISLFLLLFAPIITFSQTYTKQTTTYGGRGVGFYQFLPAGYDANAAYKYPVIIFLHGQGQVRKNDDLTAELESVNTTGLPMYLKQGASMQFPTTYGSGSDRFIVLVPQKKTDLEWIDPDNNPATPNSYQVERQWPPYLVDAMIHYATNNLDGDPNRMFLTGFSGGGGLVWDYGAFADSNAAKLTAIVPVAGRPVYGYDSSVSGGTVAGLCNLPEHGVYSRGYIGSSDGVITVDSARRAQNHINNTCPNYPLKKPSQLKILNGGHNDAFSDTVYNPNFRLGDTSLNMYQWLLEITAAPGAITPVKLKYFKGKSLNTQNILEWATTLEVNSDRIELLRSVDGEGFSVIASFKGNGNSATDKEYSYKDNNAPKGTSHYQLRQVDKDGKSELSKVVTLTNKNQAYIIEKYPNPVTDRLNVKIEGTIFGALEIQILDLKGNLVKKMAIRKDQPNWNGFIDVRELAKGMYMFHLTSSDGKKEVSSFIKN